MQLKKVSLAQLFSGYQIYRLYNEKQHKNKSNRDYIKNTRRKRIKTKSIQMGIIRLLHQLPTKIVRSCNNVPTTGLELIVAWTS